MRLFGSERIAKLMDSMGAQEGEMLTHPLITRSIEVAPAGTAVSASSAAANKARRITPYPS